MKKRSYSRRNFIGKLLGISTITTGIGMASGCKNSGKDEGKNKGTKHYKNCDDLSGLSEEEKQKRTDIGYVKETYVAGSHCGNCNLYLPPSEGEKCGGCLLFEGPVRSTGYCPQYVEKT